MKLPQTGGCQCGKLRYEITEAPQLVYTCHCTDCQRMTSSAFSMGLVIADRAFRLTGPEPRLVERTADSGARRVRWLCPRLRFVDQRRPKARLAHPDGAGRHTRRHLMAAADGASVDPQQTALGCAARGRPAL